jgi:putative transposase
LCDLTITRPNQVWCADITYIPMAHGFLYLVEVMDWASRYVLAWQLANTLDAAFCVEALEVSPARLGGGSSTPTRAASSRRPLGIEKGWTHEPV